MLSYTQTNNKSYIDCRSSPPTGKKLYETHVPISKIERTVLTAASAVAALNNPLRGGKIPSKRK